MPTKSTTLKPAAKAGAKTGAKAGAAKAGATKAGLARRLTKPQPVHGDAPPVMAQADPMAEPAGDGQVSGQVSGKAAVTAMRLKDLVELVVAATGGKRKGVKEIVEATLTQMGDALHRGETLHLPNFGKARVARQGSEGGGAMTVKLRRSTGEGGKGKAAVADESDGLADDSDQG